MKIKPPKVKEIKETVKKLSPVEIKDGNIKVKKLNQVLEDHLNASPFYAGLSDADKKNVRDAIMTTGVVHKVIEDPVSGFSFAKYLLGKEAEEQSVPVKVDDNAPATGKTWQLTAACIVQQEKDLITAFFDTEAPPANWDSIKPGHAVELKAPYCKAYK